jgi:hypothetical protein
MSRRRRRRRRRRRSGRAMTAGRISSQPLRLELFGPTDGLHRGAPLGPSSIGPSSVMTDPSAARSAFGRGPSWVHPTCLGGESESCDAYRRRTAATHRLYVPRKCRQTLLAGEKSRPVRAKVPADASTTTNVRNACSHGLLAADFDTVRPSLSLSLTRRLAGGVRTVTKTRVNRLIDRSSNHTDVRRRI